MENNITNTPPIIPTTNIPVKKSKLKKRLTVFLCLIIIALVAYVYICGMSYSNGTRTGVVIKVSQKGYVFKTYEGELNLGGISEGDGTLMPTKVWKFSIQKNDTTNYNLVTNTQGKHVRLHYKELIKNFFWQSETNYVVQKIELVN